MVLAEEGGKEGRKERGEGGSFTFGVRDDRFVGGFPVDVSGQVLDPGVGDDDVGVGAALGEALGEAHPAVGELAFVPEDVDQSPDHLGLRDWVDDG